MQQRLLGKTGHASSLLALGTVMFYRMDPQAGRPVLDQALAHGVNHLDVAPSYGQAEAVVGPWLDAHRADVFVGCKTLERSAEGAWAELNRSLERLHTRVFDLYQFHAVTQFEDLEAIAQAGGAAEAFRRARDEGLIRAMGITMHGMLAPRIALAALERLDLATVMLPLNARLYAEAGYRADMERLLAVCQERQIGVQVIKAGARRPWGGRPQRYTPWYEPYDDPERLAEGIRFALSQPGVTCALSPGEVSLLPAAIQAAEDFVPMTPAEMAATIAAHAADELIFDGPHSRTP